MTRITGTIGARPVIKTHTDASNLDIGEMLPGETKIFALNTYSNTGNVPQTVTLSTKNPTNVAAATVLFTNGTNSAVINAGQSLAAQLTLTARDVENVNIAIEVDAVWA